MLSERSSRALAVIRFPLVMLVLVMHVHPEALHSGPVFTPVATALTQLGFTAVPCFFLLFMLLRRLCPSVLAVLTGGRLSPRR